MNTQFKNTQILCGGSNVKKCLAIRFWQPPAVVFLYAGLVSKREDEKGRGAYDVFQARNLAITGSFKIKSKPVSELTKRSIITKIIGRQR